MAADTNGKAIEPSHKGMNGHAKGPKTRAAKKQRSSSIYSIILRLATWFSIITILFRCPQTPDLLTPESSVICKPYFQIRSLVAPHLQPYYDTYAAPYVDSARPYYETLDRGMIKPATILGKKYGAPRIAQAQAFGQAQWEKNLQPQVSKYQDILRTQYGRTLEPHINTALHATLPYYDLAKTNALQTYYEHILPTYIIAQPYASAGYGILADFAVNTAYPYSRWALTTSGVFMDRTVWPKLRILYGENIEPQLVRIGERLGRYRDGKKIKAVVEEYDSNSSISAVSSSILSMSSSIASVYATPPPTAAATLSTAITEPEIIPESEREVREEAQKVVSHDLKEWQEKFAKAADEGSDDLEERITEITNRLASNQAEKVGKALIIQLEETVKSSLTGLKSSIIDIVKHSNYSEESEDAIGAAVRKAGVAIKGKAQAVRTWRQSYDMETNALVSKAAEDTFEILDHIRDLGLQEIGMRWAWTEGVTHKDWTKYHKLKKRFDEWRYDVEKVATSHPGLEKARAASEGVENQAMNIAEDAAKELARLKETGIWKLSASDSSDDFSTKYMPAKAAAAGQKVLKKVSEISESVAPTSQGTMDSVLSVASSSVADSVFAVSSALSTRIDSAQSIASTISGSIVGTSTGSVESLASEVKSSASSIAAQASSSVIGTQQGTIESVISVAQESVSVAADQASKSIVGTPQGSVESMASIARESVGSLSARASSSIMGEQPGMGEKIAESVNSAASVVSGSASSIMSSGPSSASSVASSASKKVWGGAMAQHVEARQIIYEDIVDESDDGSFSEKIQSMASEAGDRYSDITKAVSEALLRTSSADSPAITKMAAEKYSSALSAASVALYGTEQGTGESVSSVVSSRYADAVSAASAIIYGTQTPLTDSVAAQATSAYLAAMSRAGEHYSQAKSLVSAQISGEPKPIHQEMLSSVEVAYSDSIAAASSRLQDVVSVASTVVYGTPTPAYESALASLSSQAQSRLSEGLSAASSRWEDSKSYVAAMTTGATQKETILQQMQGQYYAGIGMAHARYSEFMEAASSAVLPKETPAHESLFNMVSERLLGTPTNPYQGAMATAEAYYSSAVAGASSQLDDLIASVASAAGGQTDYVASLAAVASSRYTEAVASASQSYVSIQAIIASKLELAASSASTAVYGSETPWTESVASKASDNWEALITKASEQVYGAPTPYILTEKFLSGASEYGAQATDAVSSQYAYVQSLIGELVVGREPDFTESVYKRLSSAYYTGAGEAVASATSYVGEAYESASSVITAMFTPPPQLESIINSASSNINAVVDAIQIGASEKIFGTSTGYIEAAQSSIADSASAAQKAISEAIYGTSTGTMESMTNAAGEAYASATAAVNAAIYGEEKGAVESAQSRLFAAVESARGRLAEYAATMGEGANEAIKQASEGVEEFASSVSSVVSAATATKGHDEL